MKRDPRQIITPYAFEIHPELLGLPLATPKRRLLALLIDLTIAAIFSAFGNLILAITSTGVFFWIAFRNRNRNKWQNILRLAGATFASALVFIVFIGVLEGTDSHDQVSEKNIAVAEQIDWKEFSEKLATTDFTDDNDIAALETYAEHIKDKALSEFDSDLNLKSTLYDSLSRAQFLTFYQSTSTADSSLTDSLRQIVVTNIAGPEISALEARNQIFADRIDDLEDQNEELQERIDNPGFIQSMRAAGEDFGLTFGWVGIYFILSLVLFKGHTPGKKILGLQVVRLNNKPIGIWYSFERFGGYAAGLATGLLGFFQIFWDANRQGIHDKIARTVVIDRRSKKMERFKDLTEQILREENLFEGTDENKNVNNDS